MASGEYNIEVVRGRLETSVGDELVSFWSEQGALSEAAARQRLAEVVCVLRDEDGAIAGVNSAFADRVALIGGRRFWIYRSFLRPGFEEAGPAMIDAAHEALEEEFTATGEGPLGLCVLIGDEEEMRRRPEAVWPGTNFIYAGYLPDRRQVRIGYFEGAKIDRGAEGG